MADVEVVLSPKGRTGTHRTKGKERRSQDLNGKTWVRLDEKARPCKTSTFSSQTHNLLRIEGWGVIRCAGHGESGRKESNYIDFRASELPG